LKARNTDVGAADPARDTLNASSSSSESSKHGVRERGGFPPTVFPPPWLPIGTAGVQAESAASSTGTISEKSGRSDGSCSHPRSMMRRTESGTRSGIVQRRPSSHALLRKTSGSIQWKGFRCDSSWYRSCTHEGTREKSKEREVNIEVFIWVITRCMSAIYVETYVYISG